MTPKILAIVLALISMGLAGYAIRESNRAVAAAGRCLDAARKAEKAAKALEDSLR